VDPLRRIIGEMNTAITITRDPGGWVDRLRAYRIFVNGEERAEILAGERREIDVDPGPVEVFLKLDFGTSRTIRLDLSAGGRASLHCAPRSVWTVMYGVTLGRNRWMRLEKYA
jgi:hypothetical protein